MVSVLELPLLALYAIEQFCYAWSDLTVDIWETFTEYSSELLVAYTDLLDTIACPLSPLARWVLELF